MSVPGTIIVKIKDSDRGKTKLFDKKLMPTYAPFNESCLEDWIEKKQQILIVSNL